MDGIINIYKEKGYTSHDVVAKLRGILKMKRIGHTGTLDPEAEGVLPVCLGTATKLCDMMTDKIKVYRAEVIFGIATDTEDLTGKIVKELPVHCSRKDLDETIVEFEGGYEQIPPMYSAIKVAGKKLYEFAREGKTVERAARPVVIYSINVENTTEEQGLLKEAVITVVCGKGTYIRSLCRDIGERLGTCACMKSLIRLKSGQFCIENSLKLSEVEQLRTEGSLEAHVISVEQVFASCGKIRTKSTADKWLKNGNQIPLSALELSEEGTETENEIFLNRYRAYTSEDIFLGIYEKTNKQYVPFQMFF